MFNSSNKQRAPTNDDNDDTDMTEVLKYINNKNNDTAMDDNAGEGPSRQFPTQGDFQEALYASLTNQPMNHEQSNHDDESDYVCEDAGEDSDCGEEDDEEDAVTDRKGKGKARAKAKIAFNAAAEDDEEEQANDPKGKGKAKRPRRHADGYEEGIRGAPPANTDLPWHAMSEITGEEMLAYFPNHAPKWPAMAARLVEDGWSPSRIAQYINNCRKFASGSEDAVLSNTIGISMNSACGQFFGDRNYTTSTAIKAIQHRNAEEAADAKQLLTTTAWKPRQSQRYTTTLEPAWTLAQIAQAYSENHQALPTTGRFSGLLSAALLANSSNGTISSLNGRNPPVLPFGWTSAWPKGESSRKNQSSTLNADDKPEDGDSANAKTNKKVLPKGNLKLQTRGHRLNRADLPKEIRDDPDAVIREHPNELSGEILLWILSKEGGKHSCTSLQKYWVEVYGEGKVVDRSTFAKRREAALRERAKANPANRNNSYDMELANYRKNESWSKGQGGRRARAKNPKAAVNKNAVKKTVSKKTVLEVDDDDDNEPNADFRPSTRRMTRSTNTDRAPAPTSAIATQAPLMELSGRMSSTTLQASGTSYPEAGHLDQPNLDMYDASLSSAFDTEMANIDFSNVDNTNSEEPYQPAATTWPGTDVSIHEPFPWEPIDFFPPSQSFTNATAMETSLPNMGHSTDFQPTTSVAAVPSTQPYQFTDGAEYHDEMMSYTPYAMNTPEMMQDINDDIAQRYPTNADHTVNQPTAFSPIFDPPAEINSHPMFAGLGLGITNTVAPILPYQTQHEEAAFRQKTDTNMTEESDSEGSLPCSLGAALPADEFDEFFQLEPTTTTAPTSTESQRVVSLPDANTTNMRQLDLHSSLPGWGPDGGEAFVFEGNADIRDLHDNDWREGLRDAEGKRDGRCRVRKR